MRVKREVQVLSELGYRGATPVLEHMQIGLAFILAKHTYRKQVSYQLALISGGTFMHWKSLEFPLNHAVFEEVTESSLWGGGAENVWSSLSEFIPTHSLTFV